MQPVALKSHSSAPEAWPVLVAPASWRAIDFISDLHLQVSEPATMAAWQHYMVNTQADALFILGDLFEVWVGDDITTARGDLNGAFALNCQHVIKATSRRLPVYLMHGNRDFLIGADFAKACRITLLPDPVVLSFDNQRWLLSHGDALCLDDVDYQQFRRQVRSSAWCSTFLAKPQSERQDIALSLRAQSESLKTSGVAYADVDTPMALQWLETAQACTLIHGHTHKPGDYALGSVNPKLMRRLVLSDWDATAAPPRLEVLRLQKACEPERVSLTQAF